MKCFTAAVVFNNQLNKLDFRFQQEVNMAVSLNEIEMHQHAKETQEFINEDRSTHDLNMEVFGIKIEEGQQSLQQYFGRVKQEYNIGNVNNFLAAYVDNRGVQLPAT